MNRRFDCVDKDCGGEGFERNHVFPLCDKHFIQAKHGRPAVVK